MPQGHARIVAGLPVLLLLAGCAATAPTPAPATGDLPLVRGASHARAIVAVVDASAAGEPVREAAQASVEGALALAGADAVGLVAAQGDAVTVLAPLESSDAAARAEAATRLASFGRGGSRALARGVRRAYDALVASDAARGSLVLLASTEPTGTEPRELDEASGALARRGWRLVRAPLEAGSRAALASFAREGLGYLATSGSSAPASVTLTNSGGALAWIGPALPGAPPAGARVFRGSGSAVLSWPAAAAGRKFELPPGGTLLLYRPGWELAFDSDAPPPIAALGEPLPVAFEIRGAAKPEAGLDVAVEGPDGSPVALARRGLRFEGQASAPAAVGNSSVRVRVAFAAGEARFVHERTLPFLVRRREGALPPSVTVRPDRFDLGTLLVDAAAAAASSRTNVSVTLRGDPSRAVRVALAPCSWASGPGSVELAPGESRTLTLAVDPARLGAGDRLALRAELREQETERVRPRVAGDRRVATPIVPAAGVTLLVPVTAQARRLSLPGTFALERLEPGGDPVVADAALEGERAVVAKALLDDASGVEVLARIADGHLTVEGRAAPGAPPGRRTGRVEVRLAQGSNAPPLVRPLSVTVEARRELALALEPASLELKGRFGWAEGKVKVEATRAARLEARPLPLAGKDARIGVRRDVRVRAASAGWDAHALPAGEGRELLVRVYLPSDLPPGRYEGEVELTLLDERGARVARPLPVSVEVER